MAVLGCPTPVELTDVADYDCGIELSRIRRIFFAQQAEWVSVTVGPATVALLQTESEWVDTLAATDVTKTLTTPPCGEVEIVGGAPITQTFDGQERVVSYEPSTSTFQFDGMPATTVQALKELGSYQSLYVMFIDQDGKILHALNGTIPNFIKLNPRTFFASEPSKSADAGLWLINAGLSLEHDWYSEHEVVATVPNFDPFTLSN